MSYLKKILVIPLLSSLMLTTGIFQDNAYGAGFNQKINTSSCNKTTSNTDKTIEFTVTCSKNKTITGLALKSINDLSNKKFIVNVYNKNKQKVYSSKNYSSNHKITRFNDISLSIDIVFDQGE
jgi:hypothetical protein